MAQLAHDKRLSAGQRRFLNLYTKTGNISISCQGSKVGRRTVYNWLEHDESFSLAYNEAKEESIEQLEAVALDRARKQSDVLLIFLLKSLRPEKYRDRLPSQHAEIDDGNGRVVRFVVEMAE